MDWYLNRLNMFICTAFALMFDYVVVNSSSEHKVVEALLKPLWALSTKALLAIRRKL